MAIFIWCVCLATLFPRMIVTPRLLQGNVLIDFYKKPLICDFGFSRIRHEVTRTYTNIREGGRLRFLAPELLEGPEKFRTTEASDIFSLSMTFFHIWSHQPPFAHLSNDWAAAAAIQRGERPSRPDNDLGISSENMERFWNLIRRMWDEERYRPGTQEVHSELEDIFPGSPAVGDLWQLTPDARLSDREQIEQIPFTVSPQFGGSDVSKGPSFNDARSFDLDTPSRDEGSEHSDLSEAQSSSHSPSPTERPRTLSESNVRCTLIRCISCI
jgi:serine/threonine protein kinase